jgi:glycosyltransferase 2 family protein
MTDAAAGNRDATTLRKGAIRIGQLLLVLLVTYGIIRALAPEVGKVSARDFAAWTPDPGLLALSLLMLLGVYLSHCLLWRIITETLGGVKPGLQSSLRIYFVSSLGRYIPGKLWQIAGLAMLAQKARISAYAATAASLAGQFGFLTSGLVYLALLLPSWGGRAPIIGAAALIVGGIALFVLLTSNAKVWIAERLGRRFGTALELLDRITWRSAILWWLAYALSWALLGAAFVTFVSAFTPIAWSQTIHIAGTVAAAYLFGYVAFFSPAGLGIREAVMIGLLSQVMPASGALVVSVASRLWFTAAELLPLGLIPITKDR